MSSALGRQTVFMYTEGKTALEAVGKNEVK
jgi:hypothetical protein